MYSETNVRKKHPRRVLFSPQHNLGHTEDVAFVIKSGGESTVELGVDDKSYVLGALPFFNFNGFKINTAVKVAHINGHIMSLFILIRIRKSVVCQISH